MATQKEIEERIEAYKASIKIWEYELSNLEKQAEPKEGEWWYGENAGAKWVQKVSVIVGDYAYFTELYADYDTPHNGKTNEYSTLRLLKRPATTEEITYFMGLHAERLGYKAGNFECLRGWSAKPFNEWFYGNEPMYIFETDGSFGVNAIGKYMYCLREKDGTWATVVTEKPKNGKLKAKITELEERIQKAKDILNG